MARLTEQVSGFPTKNCRSEKPCGSRCKTCLEQRAVAWARWLHVTLSEYARQLDPQPVVQACVMVWGTKQACANTQDESVPVNISDAGERGGILGELNKWINNSSNEKSAAIVQNRLDIKVSELENDAYEKLDEASRQLAEGDPFQLTEGNFNTEFATNIVPAWQGMFSALLDGEGEFRDGLVRSNFKTIIRRGREQLRQRLAEMIGETFEDKDAWDRTWEDVMREKADEIKEKIRDTLENRGDEQITCLEEQRTVNECVEHLRDKFPPNRRRGRETGPGKGTPIPCETYREAYNTLLEIRDKVRMEDRSTYESVMGDVEQTANRDCPSVRGDSIRVLKKATLRQLQLNVKAEINEVIRRNYGDILSQYPALKSEVDALEEELLQMLHDRALELVDVAKLRETIVGRVGQLATRIDQMNQAFIQFRKSVAGMVDRVSDIPFEERCEKLNEMVRKAETRLRDLPDPLQGEQGQSVIDPLRQKKKMWCREDRRGAQIADEIREACEELRTEIDDVFARIPQASCEELASTINDIGGRLESLDCPGDAISQAWQNTQKQFTDKCSDTNAALRAKCRNLQNGWRKWLNAVNPSEAACDEVDAKIGQFKDNKKSLNAQQEASCADVGISFDDLEAQGNDVVSQACGGSSSAENAYCMNFRKKLDMQTIGKDKIEERKPELEDLAEKEGFSMERLADEIEQAKINIRQTVQTWLDNDRCWQSEENAAAEVKEEAEKEIQAIKDKIKNSSGAAGGGSSQRIAASFSEQIEPNPPGGTPTPPGEEAYSLEGRDVCRAINEVAGAVGEELRRNTINTCQEARNSQAAIRSAIARVRRAKRNGLCRTVVLDEDRQPLKFAKKNLDQLAELEAEFCEG